MGIKLRSGYEFFEFLEDDEYLLPLRDRGMALRFLQGLRLDSTQIADLRNRFLGDTENAKDLKDVQVLELLASTLGSGALRILRRPEISRASSFGTAVQEETQPGQAPPSAVSQAPKRNAWIEIKLVNSRGQPVPRQRYRIKLPDGSLNEGMLDEFGEAEYTAINPGMCQVSFPDLENDDWGPA